MSQVVAGKFACDACGKRYTWKPQLAGRRAKCACGARIVVPQADQSITDENELYDIADAPAAPAPAASIAAPHARGPAARTAGPTPQPVRAIDYRPKGSAVAKERDRFSFDSLTDPRRDLYVPCV